MFETKDGDVSIMSVWGNNCSIKRKSGKTEKIIEDMQLNLADTLKRPKIQDGDTLLTGPDSMFTITSSYNKGRDNPSDKWQDSAFVSLTLLPKSEAKVSVESWDKKDVKANKRVIGQAISGVEMLKGSFTANFDKCEAGLRTPTADIKFIESSGGAFDISGGNTLYFFRTRAGRIEVTNRRTKKTYMSKSKFQEEIIVAGDTIYRKPLTQMDENPMPMFVAAPGGMYKDSEEMIDKQMDAMKNMNFNDVLSGINMFTQMSPEDIEKMGKMAGMTQEQMSDMRESSKMMKKDDFTEGLGKAIAQMRGYTEGMGEQGMKEFIELQKRGTKDLRDRIEGRSEDHNIDIPMMLAKVQSPRKYAPLEAKFRVA